MSREGPTPPSGPKDKAGICPNSYLTDQPPTWPGEYPQDFQTSVQQYAGYIKDPLAGQSGMYYAQATQNKYDFHLGTGTPKGLIVEVKDPAGNTAKVTFDAYDLLPLEVEDALGMKVIADYDYRIMQASMVTDPNENRRVFRFSPLGFMQESGVLGKVNEAVGDWISETGGALLWDASTLMEYDFFNFLDNGDPVWVRTIQKEEHYQGTNPVGQNAATIRKTEYSDGFGRLLQVRAQAEDVIFGSATFGDSGLPVTQGSNANAVGIERGVNDPDNVIVNGWTIYNNKGWVVEQYEPYFDQGYDYKTPLQSHPIAIGYGQKTVQFYDPRGQVVRSLSPDGTESRAVFGIPQSLSTPDKYDPTPWESFSYDANDLAPITHPGLSTTVVPASHYFTPKSAVLDALGRTISVKDRNGQTQADWYELKYEFDIRGNALKTYDYKNRVQVSHVYSLANQPLKTTHLESGTSTVVIDASGRPLETRDQKGAFSVSTVDALMRPLKIWARDNASSPVTLRQKMTYGDSVGIANPENLNLKGQLFEHWDEAGYQKIPSLDFRGLPSSKIRQVIDDDTILSSISLGNAWTIDWSTMTNILDPTIYETKDISYDALGRVLEMTLPQDMDGSGNEKILKPEYNYAGGLQKIKLYDPVTTNTEEYVSEIAYNAKGQGILVAYGNDIMQRYAYDAQIPIAIGIQLKRVRSEKFTLSQSGQTHTYTYNAGTVRQDITHEYDLNGNIIQTADASPNSGVGGTNSLTRDFTYDPLYRLLTATGREEIKVWDHANPYSHDATSYATGAEANTRSYTRTYEYDALGNILRLNHNGGAGATFNRYFNDFNNNPTQAYQTNNLLNQVHYSGTTLNYTYDSNGNLLQEGSSRFHIWDHSDQLKAFYISASSSISKFAQYLYDAGGNRVKKVVWKSNSDAQITVYVDGVMDHIYDYDTSTQVRSFEHTELHIMDGRSRIARRRTGSPYPSDTSPVVKYNLEDHLGNSCITLKADGSLFSKEEYFPFGETSFGSFSKKRYRYVGKEKDEESGLYYYGARYYAAWTCRFVSVDPLAISFPFMAPYVYAANDPIGQFDVDGMNPSGGGGKGKKATQGKKNIPVSVLPVDPFTRETNTSSNLSPKNKSISLDKSTQELQEELEEQAQVADAVSVVHQVDAKKGMTKGEYEKQLEEWYAKLPFWERVPLATSWLNPIGNEITNRRLLGNHVEAGNDPATYLATPDYTTVNWNILLSLGGNGAPSPIGGKPVSRPANKFITFRNKAPIETLQSVQLTKPEKVRFSQKTVNNYKPIKAGMKKNGWKGDPIDIVKMPDGKMTSVDNTRVLAASESGIILHTVFHKFNDPISKTQAERFPHPNSGKLPETWGQAIEYRILAQKGFFAKNNPYGSWITRGK